MLLTLLLPTALWADPTSINSLSSLGSSGDYVITQDIDASGFNASIATFSGSLEAAIDPATNMPYRITNLSAPLFETLTGTVKNLVLEDVGISGHGGNTGAIACTANGAARIYNVGILSGSVGGTGNTGGLVGLLEGTARVVNCYSYATITGGYIGIYCGSPKFGDMSANKTVTTTATGCTFGTFFGAGYGGNSYSRYAPNNRNWVINIPGKSTDNKTYNSWNSWVTAEYTQSYSGTYGGVSTQFNYQFLPMSDNETNVARLFVEFVKFSLATTHEVTSTLNNCTIIGNFYGGGSLGKVDSTVTSVLDSCTVYGDVYGAGYSASLPTVEVDSIGFLVEPYYYESLGTYLAGVKGPTRTYTWEHANAIGIDKTNHILKSTEDLTTLGSVSGDITLTLTLKGTTVVAGDVFGGGEESSVTGDISVILQGKTHVLGNVFGGGKEGPVTGNVTVTIEE
ncbi:MAG: hypothetical protein K5864_10065 [Bacteroidales bacterium]|nr:hypothetical protein [Bacteroidales bacterium]